MSKVIKRKSEMKEESTGNGLLVRRKHFKKVNKGQNSTGNGKPGSKFKGRCYICNSFNHLRKYCPILKDYNLKKSGNTDIVSNREDSGYDSASVMVVSKTSGVVELGDNRYCKMIGVGSIRLKIDNGRITKLDKVRHVLEIKRNLISISMLDQDGCVVRVEKGKLRVIRGDKTIIEWSIVNGIYVLQENTLKDQENVASRDGVHKTIV
uniref:Retrovirus-related Pol polyprotein from transposon TNT 1-94-like beta-barrel domain-containing protein n=1 Tax=Cannabis sativa TaxID=3483 RepID=A0A803PRA4_CANSA